MSESASPRDETAVTCGGEVSAEPVPMPPNARTELWAIAERLRWLANEPDAKEGMASIVTWQVKFADARFLEAVSAALRPTPAPTIANLKAALRESAERVSFAKAVTGEPHPFVVSTQISIVSLIALHAAAEAQLKSIEGK